MLLSTALLSTVLALCGCADPAARHLSAGEAQSYKLQLIRGSRGQLSQREAVRFNSNPARTRAELDTAYRAARSATEAEAAAEKARFEAQRKSAARTKTGPEDQGQIESEAAPDDESEPGSRSPATPASRSGSPGEGSDSSASPSSSTRSSSKS